MRYDVEAIRRSVSIMDLLPPETKRQRVGEDAYRVACPLHGGERLSMGVRREANGWRFTCFACGEHGDVITFVQKREGVDFKAACERLGAGKEVAPVYVWRRPTSTVFWRHCVDRCGRWFRVEAQAGAYRDGSPYSAELDFLFRVDGIRELGWWVSRTGDVARCPMCRVRLAFGQSRSSRRAA